jgi:hypothetical protein
MNDLWQLFSPPLLLADVALAEVIMFGGLVAIIPSLGVVIIEAIVFYRCGWTWGKAFLDAILLNLISTIAGLVVYPLLINVIAVLSNNIKISPAIDRMLTYFLWGILFILAFFVSVAIEYSLLTSVRSTENRAKFKRAVVIANLCSYVAMFVFYLAIYFNFMR